MKTAILFPGQGSQYIGMGIEFVEKYPECESVLNMAEAACGLDLRKIVSQGPLEELMRGTNLQPAITATNLICYEAFKKEAPPALKVDCFAGHSLGEYSALCAAGVISAEDTLRLVSKRGALMEREGLANPGGMRAVVGLAIEEIESMIEAYEGEGVVTAANHNTPVQTVLSGSMTALDNISSAVEGRGGKVIPLNVTIANHSPLVADAVPDFVEFLRDIEFRTPSTPVYFNVSASCETDPPIMKEIMARQIASRVRWCEIIQSMLARGVDTFIEIGPKSVLKGMMRKITPKGSKVTALQLDSPEGLQSCLEKIQ